MKNIKKSLLLTTLLILGAGKFVSASPQKAMQKLGIELKDKGTPTNSFVYAVRTGNLLFLSGHISVDAKGEIIRGKLGKDLNTEQGAKAARLAGISILSTINQQLGSLDKVEKLVKVTGMVNAVPDFTEHSTVMNGFSDLMLEVFGKNGEHARAAVGMGSLPANAAVEIELILEVKEGK